VGEPLRAPRIAASTGRRGAAAGEAELWRRLREDADAEARAELIELYRPYARSIAAKIYGRRSHEGVGFDDYQQLAMVGLLEAVDRYRPDLGARFTTFAGSRVQGAILNGLEKLTERHQQDATRRRLLAERASSLLPSGRALDNGGRLLEQLGDVGVSVAFALILDGSGMGPSRTDGFPNDAYGQLELREFHRQLWTLVSRLPEAERVVVERHYQDHWQFEEIAEHLGLSKGRVSQVHKAAVERLRRLAGKAERCDISF